MAENEIVRRAQLAAEQMNDILEAAAREAAMLGDGSVVRRPDQRCERCGWWFGSVWFTSRGWTCLQCDGPRDYAPPTAEQRLAGQPNAAAQALLVTHFNQALVQRMLGRDDKESRP